MEGNIAYVSGQGAQAECWRCSKAATPTLLFSRLARSARCFLCHANAHQTAYRARAARGNSRQAKLAKITCMRVCMAGPDGELCSIRSLFGALPCNAGTSWHGLTRVPETPWASLELPGGRCCSSYAASGAAERWSDGPTERNRTSENRGQRKWVQLKQIAEIMGIIRKSETWDGRWEPGFHRTGNTWLFHGNWTRNRICRSGMRGGGKARFDADTVKVMTPPCYICIPSTDFFPFFPLFFPPLLPRL